MDFQKQKDKERSALALDRNGVYSAITSFISAAIPMNNKLKDKTDEELAELYPEEVEEAKAVRDWLKANAATVKTQLDELKALLEP